MGSTYFSFFNRCGLLQSVSICAGVLAAVPEKGLIMKDSPRDCFAVTPPGLEATCFQELVRLGLSPQEPVTGGVGFSGGVRDIYLANLWLRSANRILVRLGTLTARDFPTLYQRLVRLPWGRYIKPETACAVRATSQRSRLSHSGRIVEVCREAISKALGSSVVGAGPTQMVLLRVSDDQVEVSIDSSGDHLHRRGYRQARSAAPLRENLAAAALLSCGYDGSLPLVDMMTGSGTFAIEAGLIAANKAPGAGRDFSFMLWPKYREQLWRELLSEAKKGERDSGFALIKGVDNNPRAITAAHANLARAGLSAGIEISLGKLQDLVPAGARGLLIGNPPYGARLGGCADLRPFYRDIEYLCGEVFTSWTCALLCPAAVAGQLRKLKLDPLLGFSHGGIRVSLYVKEPGKSS
jgi:putative N6-adenine-specific DNA methylase